MEVHDPWVISEGERGNVGQGLSDEGAGSEVLRGVSGLGVMHLENETNLRLKMWNHITKNKFSQRNLTVKHTFFLNV